MSNPPMPTERTYGGYTLGYIEGQLAAMSQDVSTLQSLVAHIRELEAALKLERDTLAHINAEAETGDKECCYQNRRLEARVAELEAANAALTAERDDAVTLARKWQGKQSATALRNTELNRRVHRLEADLARVTAEKCKLAADAASYLGQLLEVTAERDARVVLPELDIGKPIVIGRAARDTYYTDLFDYQIDPTPRAVIRRTAPTPAAALEALKQKMEDKQ